MAGWWPWTEEGGRGSTYGDYVDIMTCLGSGKLGVGPGQDMVLESFSQGARD